MTVLPIVERELRVAARKKRTAWLRVVAALLALVIGAGFLLMSMAIGSRTSSFGGPMFATLSWLSLAATLGAGLFFTADCLSEEKREGTLGFLFLTDLRGYDVVGGKLLATSLKGCYALLAIFPIFAITLVMGGITGLQLCRSVLALINALFCSLSAGLLISAVSRDAQRAMAGTLLLLLLTCAAGPITDATVSAATKTAFRPVLSLTSPIYVFWAASAWGRTPYWLGLIMSHSIAWMWLVAACLLVPRSWQERPTKRPPLAGGRGYDPLRGEPVSRRARRNRLLYPNPVVWLALRERWQSVAAWTLAGLLLIGFGVLLITLPPMLWMVWNQISSLILVVVYLWTASQASRFFVDARRSGLMELLLVSPLHSRSIVAGQWHALLRLFGLPVICLVLVQLAVAIMSQRSSLNVMSPTGMGSGLSFAYALLSAVTTLVNVPANLIALGWFGMWMGLTSKGGNTAALKTLLFVQVLPWLAISFVSTSLAGLLMFGGLLKNRAPSNTMLFSFPLLMAGLAGVLTLAKDVAFCSWARGRLYSRFRVEAARSDSKGMTKAFSPQETTVPPVIAAP